MKSNKNVSLLQNCERSELRFEFSAEKLKVMDMRHFKRFSKECAQKRTFISFFQSIVDPSKSIKLIIGFHVAAPDSASKSASRAEKNSDFET